MNSQSSETEGENKPDQRRDTALPIQSDKAAVSAEPANNEGKNTRGTAYWEKRQYWVQTTIAVVGAVSVVIYAFQLYEMRKSTDAATKAAKAAEDGIKRAEASSHLDQRAWVSAGVGTDVPTVGKVFTVNVTARNSGKTFARDFQSRVIINIVERDAEPAFALGRQTAAKAHGTASVSVLPPTGEYSTATDVDPDGKPGPITQEIFDNLSSGRTKLFVFGWVTYFDIFRCDHWTIFCNEMLPGSVPGTFKWRTYSTHNDADVNECTD